MFRTEKTVLARWAQPEQKVKDLDNIFEPVFFNSLK
jgi:hypothetical protein